MIKRTPWHLTIALIAGLMTLSAHAATRQVEDAFGNTVTVPAEPERVVTLNEIDLDTALTLGVTPIGTVNGRGQAAPPRYLEGKVPSGIKVVGDLDNPNLETLLELEPDLILTGPVKPEQLAILNEIAPTVTTFKWAEPWQSSMQRTAHVLNKDAEAKAFLDRYEARAAEARERLKDHQGETFSIVRWNPKGPSYMFKDAFSSTVVEDVGLVRPAHQQDPGHTHSMALSLESLELLDADWLVIGTLATSGEAVEALSQAEETPAFRQLSSIQAKRFAAVDGSLWTSLGGPMAALQVIEDVESIVGKTDADPVAKN
ncbi:ABC transporter substrate-binding protein [Pseudomonas sp. Choline-3u-10]|jgi:iron complex transport system substrate-binding protein|uniref:ABC transporter substrate-binding protein n=1 Tax=Pseudomonadaceae TaxID=135621 RepID=UPI00061E4367|nr:MULTISPECIES: ABC transporter substrate-binding protein [Pseudomonadaceae]MAL36853.1 ABC transporter substrate-binding protein [Pseudomonas sp.]MBU0950766.1 ABC transporter substrate-binding protein [Gammaproteobacteria bacterium]KJJ65215.1 ABC transporter substrate-binding protein [Pseudomonas sp. 10B238]MBK3795556.1 ABC transporter substrate-binding protein [Stutzerimonas stutzeri]MBK3878089.1 ABC transporter substrate-binding protein [Stutzerimonas stutzeri]